MPTENQVSPSAAPETQPDPKPAESLLSQYELPDTAPQPEVDLAPEKPTDKPVEAVQQTRKEDGTFGHKHSTRLVRMATELGLSDAEIAEKTPDALEEAVYQLHKSTLAEARKAATSFSASSQEPPKPAPPVEEEIDLGLDPEAYDADLLKAIKGAVAKPWAKVKELEARLAAAEGREAERMGQSIRSKVDRAIDGLNDTRFGKSEALSDDGPELARRRAVVFEAQRLAGEGATLQQQLAKIAQAHKNLFGEAQPTAPTEIQKRWQEGGVAKPTQREGKEPKGEARAMKAAAAYMKDNGLLDDDDLSELNGLPE